MFIDQRMERTRDASGYGATVRIRSQGPSAAANLGAIMQAASSRFDAATMLGVVFLVSLFGLLLQEGVRQAEARLLPWSVRGRA